MRTNPAWLDDGSPMRCSYRHVPFGDAADPGADLSLRLSLATRAAERPGSGTPVWVRVRWNAYCGELVRACNG